MISERTTAALARAKARGVRLGNPTNLNVATAKGVESNRKIAAAFAANVLPVIASIRASGATSYSAIANALNARGVFSPRGGAWHASSVRNIMRRSA